MISSCKLWLFSIFMCLVTVGLLGCTDSGTTVPLTISNTIGASGGSIQDIAVTGGTMSVDIPAGALAADTDITVTPLSIADLPAPVPASKIFVGVTFGPAGTTFASGKPVVVTFPLAVAKVAGLKLAVLLWNPTNLTWDIEDEATVSADGMFATVSLTHFSTYVLVDSSGILFDTTKFMLGSGKAYTGTPTPFTPDIVFSGNVANNSASMLFNCPLQKVASPYDSITAAPSGTYISNLTYSAGSETLPLTVGDVFVGNAKDYTGYPMAPPTTFYFKLRVIAISYPNNAATMIFEYQRIKNPLNVNPG
ncbi:MAG: hypothetical protein WCO98_09025 [bacterium]